MKKSLLLSLICNAFLASGVNAQDSEKMTYEKALQSHKDTYGKYQAQSITPEESQLAWDSHIQKSEEIDGGSDGGQLEEVWKGSAVSVPVTWGQGDYYVEITFGRDNQGGSAWLTIDNSSIKKNVAIPSPFQFEGNYHIQYGSGTLTAKSVRASGTPKITRISKFPTPQLNDCTAGQTESQTLYCTGSGQMTCEPGKRSRTCASNGGWTPWQTVRQPSCITGTQQCR